MQSELKSDLIQESEPYVMQLVTGNRYGYYMIKRIIDFALAALLLVIFSPLMVIIGLSIVLYSPGPIFFSQERVGAKRYYYGKQLSWGRSNFSCYKFRTMRINADTSIHQAYIQALIGNDQTQIDAIQGQVSNIRKLVRDPRITRPGKFLRKFSLDELPQLWNVLRGDMSLVGPRPAIPYEVELYKPWYMQRLEAQPGITGLQQITARSAIDFDNQVLLDIRYIEKQSLWFDFEIMLKTPFVVISTRGAH